MKKKFTKISLLAGIAVLLGAASSAEAQCSQGYGGGYYAPYVDSYSSCQPQPVYGNYGYSNVQVYDYGSSRSQQRVYPSNYGSSQCSSGSVRTQVRTQQYVRPRVVTTYSQPVYGRAYAPSSGGCSSGGYR